MILVLKGIVETGDAYRVESVEEQGAILIGGKDLIDEIEEAKFTGKVTVGIADQTFTGELFYEMGWGYSEWTPMEQDSLKVGSHDLLEILERYENQEIIVFIADEPVNILEYI
jgi:hypothetical protein